MPTPDTPDTTERDLGRLEGRVEEQGARLDQFHADVTSGFQQVNARIDRLLLAMSGVGGGMLAALVGIIITLLLQGAP